MFLCHGLFSPSSGSTSDASFSSAAKSYSQKGRRDQRGRSPYLQSKIRIARHGGM